MPKVGVPLVGLKVLFVELVIHMLIWLVVWRRNPTFDPWACAFLAFFYWPFVCILLLSGYCLVIRFMRLASAKPKKG